ncbi:ABC transporter substrate-binding protein [Paenibacillus sp. CAU 1782]
MKQKWLATALIAVLLLTGACAGNSGSDNKPALSNEPTGKTFTIGILPAEGAIPIILAHELGYLKEEGADMSIKAFASPNDRNVAVQAGELDATIGDVMTEAAFKQNGIDMVITSDISEDFKILSSPGSGITSIEGLADKKVSLVPNFLLEYIMDHFADQKGYSYTIVEIPSFSGRAEALLSDQVDGVVFTEPQAGMLVQQGAHLLAGSREAGIKGGTLQFTAKMVDERPGDIAAFYKAYNRAVDYMNETDASEYVGILSDYQFPEQIGLYLASLKNSFQHAGSISEEQVKSIVDWSLDKGMLKQAFTYEELTNFSFLP